MHAEVPQTSFRSSLVSFFMIKMLLVVQSNHSTAVRKQLLHSMCVLSRYLDIFAAVYICCSSLIEGRLTDCGLYSHIHMCDTWTVPENVANAKDFLLWMCAGLILGGLFGGFGVF